MTKSVLALLSTIGLAQASTNVDGNIKLQLVSEIEINTQLLLDSSKDFQMQNENLEVARHYSHRSHYSSSY